MTTPPPEPDPLAAGEPDPLAAGEPDPLAAGEPDGPPIAGLTRGAFAQLTAEDFDFMASMGGIRGLVESTLPGLVFVVVFVASHNLVPALIGSTALAVLPLGVRVYSRQPLTTVLGGFLGVMIGVVWAWQSGEASNYFVWGLMVNAAYLLGVLISVLVRWPLVGLIMALARGEWTTWRDSANYRRYVAATWLWVGLFAARLAVQLPLYLAGEVALLGTARLVMGVPLFALIMWFTWLLVRVPAESEPPEGTAHP